ncbi:MAG TPA: anaerobic glycerol-3-phosphate dehydrogenase subunit GlpB [Solirubrobacteraceae bacterium]|nr:anaerobic glycerol-3-phosphate dehydrogenase subunit GlpB [Solirubrobacteraceae bacterium]
MSWADAARRFDAVVIGAGTAGMTAAIALAQAGARVCVLAFGLGSTHLAAGTIDVLGAIDGEDPVRSPQRSLARLASARPDHPYALMGASTVAEALAWFARTFAGAAPRGYGYVGDAGRNMMLPTALGTLRPSALVPTTMAAGDAAGLDRVAIAGTPALRDFHPGLCAANLRDAGIRARAVQIQLDLDRADASALGVARRLEEPAWRAAFCRRLGAVLGAEDRVGLPAMIGLHQAAQVLADMEQRLQRRVFEIPTLPPSVPGMRLFEALRRALRAAGGTLVLGAEVSGAERSGGRVLSVAARSAGRQTRYRAPWFVLASGGLGAGAIELDSRGRARERVLGLGLRGVAPASAPRFVEDFFAEQPLARVGVAVDERLCAQDAPNVVVAGAALPGQAPWLEGCGEGVALASGLWAARLVSAELGGRCQATQRSSPGSMPGDAAKPGIDATRRPSPGSMPGDTATESGDRCQRMER